MSTASRFTERTWQAMSLLADPFVKVQQSSEPELSALG